MLSPNALLPELRRLARIAANPPEPDELTDLCADWIEIIGDEMDDAALRPAITAYLKESGFWPRPNDVLQHGRPIMAQQRAAKQKAIEAAKPSRIFEIEPDPPGVLEGEFVERWGYLDWEEGRCSPDKLGRIKRVCPRPALWVAR